MSYDPYAPSGNPYPYPIDLSALTPEWFHRTATSTWNVNKFNALSVPAIKKALTKRSDRAAKVPVDVYQNDKDGRIVANEHPAQRLLKLRPAKNLTPFEFRKQVCFEVDLFGNSFWYINRDADANPLSLTHLLPELVGYWTLNDEEYYVYGEGQKFLPENILHFKHLTFDTIMGVSPLITLAKTIRLNLILTEYETKYFESPAGRVRLILKFPPTIKDPLEQQEYLDKFNKFHSGVENSGKVAGVSHNMEVDQIPFDNQGAEIVALSDQQLISIANCFNVKPHDVGVKIGTSYASLIEENDSFLEDLDGFLTMFEEVCSNRLLTEKQILSETHFIECNRDAARIMDKLKEEEIIEKQFLTGGLGWKERRKLKNMPTENVDDIFFVPNNCTAVGSDMKPIVEPPPVAPGAAPGQDPTTGPEPHQGAAPGEPLARQLTEKVVDRLILRVQKHLDQKLHRQQLPEIVRSLRDDHEQTFAEWLEVFPTGSERLEAFFSGLETELASITRSDVGNINWHHYRSILNATI